MGAAQLGEECSAPALRPLGAVRHSHQFCSQRKGLARVPSFRVERIDRVPQKGVDEPGETLRQLGDFFELKIGAFLHDVDTMPLS